MRGWITGTSAEHPPRLLPVSGLVSPVPRFDEELLALARWVSERYVAPLAAVLGRLAPPRVASEETAVVPPPARGATAGSLALPRPLTTYAGGPELLAAIGRRDPGPRAFVLRPAPEDEQDLAVEAVAACLASGRTALVLVPEAEPVPATAAAIERAFGERCARFLGGSKRARYRTWLDIGRGRFDVVVATRPGIFAPLAGLGLIYVSRESHPAHREDRAPYYHVRDVARARARMAGAVCVQAAFCPSAEAAAAGDPEVRPPARRWPPVEVVPPVREGRAPALVRAIRTVRRGFLFSPTPGAGIAVVCKSCGSPAACAACEGSLRLQEGVVRCVVCEAPGRCRVCSATSFGVHRGGAERVEAWAAAVAGVPVHRLRAGETPRLPGSAEILVGGPDDVRDLGPGGCDLVAILDADLAARRPGLAARERSLATWFEAVAWARPAGRAIVQTAHARDTAVQALVRGNADRFHEEERARRISAGFPVGAGVFRVAGTDSLAGALRALEPITMLVSGLASGGEEATVCLVALEPERVPAFGRRIRELAAEGVVARVEAEPHL